MADRAAGTKGQGPRLDFPGFAQEFLRRNPAYRRDYDGVMSDPRSGSAAQEGMALRWGLCFPDRSAPPCNRDDRGMVCQPLS